MYILHNIKQIRGLIISKCMYPFVLALRFGTFLFLIYAVVFAYAEALTTFIHTYIKKCSPKQMVMPYAPCSFRKKI